MCLIYRKSLMLSVTLKHRRVETITGKDFEDQAISTLALVHDWLKYWSKNTVTSLPSRK